MNLRRYPFTCSEDGLEYYFDSTGPNGVIRKVVEYSRYPDMNLVYNLGFGDLDQASGEINDFINSGNNDRDLVIATVAATALAFMARYPQMRVVAFGSNAARTRLYQMAISSRWRDISLMVNILGYRDGQWEPFRKNINYDAFFAERKSITFKQFQHEQREKTPESN